ncbi:uncharacterized protein F5891DRAFT_1168805 [Suillus fuscotomentosus]|uniref:CHAT domain-containing protein n=1 Tax=Suillus fuscotomentosus TaxID=1912939 RepID=A0AAD4EMC4_9AGAM|nr:uncharacterized protein F5891DRAFT_1168805 [Suillus fuscotomentosus]KAG1908830.1 hypothetical protein F5891DRAFT_1168805 [Suillus fuscotomentosus]
MVFWMTCFGQDTMASAQAVPRPPCQRYLNLTVASRSAVVEFVGWRSTYCIIPLDWQVFGVPVLQFQLSHLANSLLDKFWHHGVMFDLDEAIDPLPPPPGHSNRSSSLKNLAISLHNRFRQRGITSELDEAIELHRDALFLRPPGHSDRSCLRDRFQQRGIMSDLDKAIELHRDALLLRPSGHSASRSDLRVAKSWAALADTLNHASALLSYNTALKFLDQHDALLSPSSHHFDVIRKAVSSLATDVFSCSVRHVALTTAVELVEQGRAVFWTQLARFNTPLDELSVSGDTDQYPQIRQLTMQWDDVVSRIRMLPDFSRFLLPPLFSDLQKAAEDGPVIIVNASQYHCDALIVLSDEYPVHVPIDITQTEVADLSSKFQSLSKEFGSLETQLKLVSILRKIRHGVVGPVVQALKISNIRHDSRIWWCPTAEFTLLPLHAAGAYEKKRDSLSHIYISSYTPTLATLVRARRQVSRDGSLQHFAVIVQGNGGKPLECVAPEVAVVAKRLGHVVSSFTSLEDSDAIVKGAFDALKLIGSMWSVDDEVAQEVVSAFYDHLIDGSGRLDCTRAAMALHKAVKKLWRSDIPLQQRIVFVHIGV